MRGNKTFHGIFFSFYFNLTNVFLRFSSLFVKEKTRLLTELGEKYNYKRLPLHLQYYYTTIFPQNQFYPSRKKKSQSKPNPSKTDE